MLRYNNWIDTEVICRFNENNAIKTKIAGCLFLRILNNLNCLK